MNVTDRAEAANRMSVLHISTADNWGGSSRSAYRIHVGLRRLGVSSRLLVGMKMTDDPDVGHVASRPMRLLDRTCGAVTDRLSLQYLFYPSSFALAWQRWFKEADIVQLYNTHGYFSHTALPLLCRYRPVIWRLSDMWPFTGHCTYAYDCERWKTGCGACPLLSDPPALRRDTTALLWRVKRFVYGRSMLEVVAPSRWIARLVRESPLLGRFPIHVIPNGLDLTVFRPIPRPAARAVLNLPADCQVVLFSAQFLSDRRKGAAVMNEVLGRVMATGANSVHVLVVGAGAQDWKPSAVLPIRRIEHVYNDELMAAIYSAADVMAFPSLAENLPNGVLESMACATPVVAFDIGGCPEVVCHLETGYLAKYNDVADFSHGIRELLADAQLRARLGSAARNAVEREFGLDTQAQRHLDLYRATTGRAM